MAKKVDIQFTTAEEYGAYKNAKIAELEKAVLDYNEAEKVDVRDKVESEIDTLCAHIKEAARCEAMMECMAFDNPVYEACRRRFYTVTKVQIKDKVMKTIEKDIEIDLTTFNSTVWIKWKYMAELLCRYCTQELASKVGSKATLDAMDRFKLSEEAIANGKMSVGSVKKALEQIIPAMLGEDVHPTNHDARFFKESFTKKGRGLVIKALTPKQTVGVLMDIAYHLITNLPYEVVQRNIKKAD